MRLARKLPIVTRTAASPALGMDRPDDEPRIAPEPVRLLAIGLDLEDSSESICLSLIHI